MQMRDLRTPTDLKRASTAVKMVEPEAGTALCLVDLRNPWQACRHATLELVFCAVFVCAFCGVW